MTTIESHSASLFLADPPKGVMLDGELMWLLHAHFLIYYLIDASNHRCKVAVAFDDQTGVDNGMSNSVSKLNPSKFLNIQGIALTQVNIDHIEDCHTIEKYEPIRRRNTGALSELHVLCLPVSGTFSGMN
jgi:hypothetical protein